jgi:hypothetical protein
MIFLRILGLFLLTSCATKYILPGNRFITPESQGKMFESQFELQQTSATQANIDISNGSVKNPLIYTDTKKTGFLFSTSVLDSMDFYWSNTGTGNSMFGAKLQFLGESRIAKAAGHKLAATFGIGGNDHHLDGNPGVDFTLGGTDFSLIHGYRFNEFFMLYDALAYSKYQFSGTLTSNNSTLNGLKPSFSNKIIAAFLGAEVSYSAFFAKLEFGYQTLDSSYTKKRNATVLGYSVGVSW